MDRLQRVERIVDRALPWLILALVPLIVIEFFVDPSSVLGIFIDVFDWLVIGVLVLDLSFKVRHATSIKRFFRGHWLEILSLLPVFLVLRVFEGLSILVEAGEVAQEVAGEVASVEQEASRLGKSARTGSASRMTMFRRLVRPLARLPRFSKAAQFYLHPDERGSA